VANEKSIDELKAIVDQLIRVEEEVMDLTEKTINQAESVTVKYLLKQFSTIRGNTLILAGLLWRSWGSKKLWGHRKERKSGIY